MGLEEKRIQQDYVKTRIPERLKQLQEATGGATASLQVDFDWDTLMDSRPALDGLWSCWEQPIGAIEAICSDDLGKEAVKKGVKKVVIRNVDDNSKVAATFDKGVLIVSFNFKEGASGTTGWDVIKKAVEDKL